MICHDQVHKVAGAASRVLISSVSRARERVREKRANSRARRAARHVRGGGNMFRLPWRWQPQDVAVVLPSAAEEAAELGLMRQRAMDIHGAVTAYEVGCMIVYPYPLVTGLN